MSEKFKLGYTVLGEEGAPAILFLHGFLGNSGDWLAVAEPLARTYRVLLADLPGHGRSANLPAAAEWSFAQTTQSILSLTDRLNIRPLHIVGYSMGGRIALYLALHFPHYVQSVIVESASPGLETTPEQSLRREWERSVAERLRTIPLADFVPKWYEMPLFSSLHTHPGLPGLISRRITDNPSTLPLAKAFVDLGTGNQPQLWQKLAGNKIPLLLVTGEKDTKFCTIAERMAERGGNASVVRVSRCGHNIHFEAPERFTEIVDEFVKMSSR